MRRHGLRFQQLVRLLRAKQLALEISGAHALGDQLRVAALQASVGIGQTWTTPEDLGDGGMGWNSVSFTSNDTAFVIHGPYAYCCAGGPGELWKSTDGGVTWRTLLVAPS